MRLTRRFSGSPCVTTTNDSHRPAGGAEGQSNKRMQLTKLRAAPVLQAEVPPCAPAGQTDGGTASQLIRGVRRLVRGCEAAERPCG